MPPASIPATRLEIDLEALRHNYLFFREKVDPEVKMLGVVKAYGYGSESVAMAKELVELGADYLAVAYVKEGVALRDAGIRLPILVLHPQIPDLPELIDRCLEPALYSPRLLKAFIAAAEAKAQTDYPVHIKFNTGLNRLGFWENDVSWIWEQLESNSSIKVLSLFSHLAASDDLEEDPFNQGQIDGFKNIVADFTSQTGLQPFLHQSNTSGILNYPQAHFDMVRCGIGLHGFSNDPKIDGDLIPIATLMTTISQLHKIEPGESVGYNRAYKADVYRTIATLPIGHADGIVRALGNGKGSVMIHGSVAPIVGNVCMDMIMVDVTGIDCKEGDAVEVFGKNHSAAAMASQAGSISYELITAISLRVPRIILG